MIWLWEIFLKYDIRPCSYFLLLKRFPLTVGLHKGSYNSPALKTDVECSALDLIWSWEKPVFCWESISHSNSGCRKHVQQQQWNTFGLKRSDNCATSLCRTGFCSLGFAPNPHLCWSLYDGETASITRFPCPPSVLQFKPVRAWTKCSQHSLQLYAPCFQTAFAPSDDRDPTGRLHCSDFSFVFLKTTFICVSPFQRTLKMPPSTRLCK